MRGLRPAHGAAAAARHVHAVQPGREGERRLLQERPTDGDVWIYDARTNVPGITKKDRPLTAQHFAEFEQCYGADPNGRSKRKDLGERAACAVSHQRDQGARFQARHHVAEGRVARRQRRPCPSRKTSPPKRSPNWKPSSMTCAKSSPSSSRKRRGGMSDELPEGWARRHSWTWRHARWLRCQPKSTFTMSQPMGTFGFLRFTIGEEACYKAFFPENPTLKTCPTPG